MSTESVIFGSMAIPMKETAWGRIRNMLSFLNGLYTHSSQITATGRPDVVIASSTYPLDIYPAHKLAKSMVPC